MVTTTTPQHVVDWLLDGDPAIVWQVKRDLLDLPERDWTDTRRLIAERGWGRRTLALQDDAGTWGGGLYTPKWTSTNYTLLLLMRMGLCHSNAPAKWGCMALLDGADWHEGGVSYWKTHKFAERCVNGMALAVCSYFRIDDPRVDSIADLLLRVPVSGGGWNCDDYRGGTHASFHTTISVLEGLLEWKRARSTTAADDVIADGQEVLLAHEMYKSHRTAAVINEAWLRPTFPPRWHYDVLRGLDHLRESGRAPDSRAHDAVASIVSRRRSDGRWPKGGQYSGRTHFTMEPGRVAGRWNTMRALRVLRWWQTLGT